MEESDQDHAITVRGDLDWSQARDGRMADFATVDDAVPTIVYAGEVG